ncbi:MAG: hypothetical protein AB1898_29870 [Acidobacteriota bacterium]
MLFLVVLLSVVAFQVKALRAQEVYTNSQLPWHPAVLDAQGKLLAWHHPEKNLGYDQFVRLAWDFLEHKVPIDAKTGVKVYLTSSIYDGKTLQGTGWRNNPASTFAHFVDFLLSWYPYSGDEEAIGVVRGMLDYQLAHGTTPMDWKWPGVPIPTACGGDKEYGRCFRITPVDYVGGIETDKLGELGLAYIQFYEMTGERKYLDAGLQCAKVLAENVRPGDALNSPWPFRVDARTGSVFAGEQYGGMVVASVRLFEELTRLGLGDTASFKKARDLAWDWIQKHPLNRTSQAWDNWSGYYEDDPTDTIKTSDMNPMMTSYYLLTHDDPSVVNEQWEIHVGRLIDRSRLLLGRGPFFGAWGIDEGVRPDGGVIGAWGNPALLPPGGELLGTYGRGCCSRVGLSCRSAQWGAINAIFFEKTGDGHARENAFRSLNYATYFAASDGKISCCGRGSGGDYWFEDGYADAGRSFMWAMGAVPEFAPIGQDHLLRSSSVVQKVSYGNRKVEYRTFDNAGAEVLRLSFKPVRVTAQGTALAERNDLKEEGYTVRALPDGDYIVRLRRVKSKEARISGD